jgi:hypothetical protein
MPPATITGRNFLFKFRRLFNKSLRVLYQLYRGLAQLFGFAANLFGCQACPARN